MRVCVRARVCVCVSVCLSVCLSDVLFLSVRNRFEEGNIMLMRDGLNPKLNSKQTGLKQETSW